MRTHMHERRRPTATTGKCSDQRLDLTHTHTHTNTYLHACTHTYIHTYIHTHKQTYIHAMYVRTHNAQTTYIHTHACIYTYIHAYIHTCMHIHTYTHACEPSLPIISKHAYTYHLRRFRRFRRSACFEDVAAPGTCNGCHKWVA